MRFLCIGAGAIGTYVGGSLLAAGETVTFVERADAVDRIRAQGMSIIQADGTELLLETVTIVATVEEALRLGDYDAAIFAVKSFHTDAVLSGLKPVLDRLPPFLSLQNGVENEGKLEAVSGSERVIPVSVCTAIARLDRGAIQVSKLRGIGIAAAHPLSRDLYAAFTKAGLKPGLIADGTGMKWSKMISNLLSNAASAILNMTPAEVYADPDSYDLERKQLLETLAVMKAYGIPVVDLPGVPVRLLCFAIRTLPPSWGRKVLSATIGGGRGSKMPSFYIDLHSGSRENEVEFLNGAVVRFGERRGVPTPINRLYYRTLTAMTEGRIAIDAFDHAPVRLFEQLADPENLR